MLKANSTHIASVNESQISILAEKFRSLTKLENSNKNLLEVVGSLGGTVSYDNPNNWNDGQMASLKVDALNNNFEIILSQGLSFEYTNYAIAHELGHYVLHSELGKKNLEFSLHGDNTLEDEASFFAYNLLMPSKSFNQTFNKLDKSIITTAICFNVPLHIAQIKIADLGS